MADQQKPKSTRGFASMTPDRRREIARLGGRSVPAEKRSFSTDPTLASSAGRKGGYAAKHPETHAKGAAKD